MYSSLKHANNASIFAQNNPRFFCKNERRFLEISLSKGFRVKCRRARCSLECNQAWAFKHSSCVDRLLRDLPIDLKVYRGHLRMPPSSTPADHARVKKEFLRILNRWKSKHGYTIEIHAVLDIRSPTDAHWDTVAYSDAPRKPLRAVLSESWARAGGLRQSLVPVDPSELAAVARYNSKYTNKTKIKVHRGDRFIPADRKVCGLDHLWSTAGFWRGETIETIWQMLILEWLADDEDPDNESRGVSNKEYTLLEPDPDPKIALQGARKLAEFRREIEVRLAELDSPNGVIKRIKRHLPFDPVKAPSLRQLSSQWGLSSSYLFSLLVNEPGVARAKGTKDFGWDDIFWIDTSKHKITFNLPMRTNDQ